MAVQPCVLIIKRLTKSGGKPQVQYHLWAHVLDCNYLQEKTLQFTRAIRIFMQADFHARQK